MRRRSVHFGKQRLLRLLRLFPAGATTIEKFDKLLRVDCWALSKPGRTPNTP